MAVNSKGNYGSKPGPKSVGPKPSNSNEKAATAWTKARNQAVKNLGSRPSNSNEKALAAWSKSYNTISGKSSRTTSMGRATKGK